jgi:hypothetical protein
MVTQELLVEETKIKTSLGNMLSIELGLSRRARQAHLAHHRSHRLPHA